MEVNYLMFSGPRSKSSWSVVRVQPSYKEAGKLSCGSREGRTPQSTGSQLAIRREWGQATKMISRWKWGKEKEQVCACEREQREGTGVDKAKSVLKYFCHSPWKRITIEWYQITWILGLLLTFAEGSRASHFLSICFLPKSDQYYKKMWIVDWITWS
jgi:hypothetical protein